MRALGANNALCFPALPQLSSTQHSQLAGPHSRSSLSRSLLLSGYGHLASNCIQTNRVKYQAISSLALQMSFDHHKLNINQTTGRWYLRDKILAAIQCRLTCFKLLLQLLGFLLLQASLDDNRRLFNLCATSMSHALPLRSSALIHLLHMTYAFTLRAFANVLQLDPAEYRIIQIHPWKTKACLPTPWPPSSPAL